MCRKLHVWHHSLPDQEYQYIKHNSCRNSFFAYHAKTVVPRERIGLPGLIPPAVDQAEMGAMRRQARMLASNRDRLAWQAARRSCTLPAAASSPLNVALSRASSNRWYDLRPFTTLTLFWEDHSRHLEV